MQPVDEEASWRAALSALLDGEEPPLPVPGIAAHLDASPASTASLAHYGRPHH